MLFVGMISLYVLCHQDGGGGRGGGLCYSPFWLILVFFWRLAFCYPENNPEEHQKTKNTPPVRASEVP